MSHQNSRATPVAFPSPVVAPAPRPLQVPRALTSPVRVAWRHVTLELQSGSLLVGRSGECDLVLDDPLVSRIHARLLITSEGVQIEDLHSTNGVYINGDRLVRSAALNEGDRPLLGTQELAFSQLESPLEALPPLLPEPDADTGPLGSQAVPQTPRTPQSTSALPPTARVEALDMIGTLARRLANEKKAEEAPRLLGPHLRGILRGASSGLPVPEALAAAASEYAIDLAHWTASSRWLDYVIELHLVTKRVLPAPIMTALQRAERWVGPLNRPLLEYYVAAFTDTGPRDAEERARLAMLRRILKRR